MAVPGHATEAITRHMHAISLEAMKKFEYSTSARRDVRTYLILLVSLGFLWAGATVNPESNCDASGRECAPWLIPVALWMGGVGTAMGLGFLAFNRKRGSRLDMAQRRLFWWDSLVSADTHGIALDEVARIRVQQHSESSDLIFLYDHENALIRFPEERAIPYSPAQWARDLAIHFPHITVEIEES